MTLMPVSVNVARVAGIADLPQTVGSPGGAGTPAGAHIETFGAVNDAVRG
ncbi:hypothetical protein JOF56_001788 [Kibdelosporangium banguiense]|uniref:Uncharacterized protein n=1 Tax=Kibdelosporangium banguiense TaxID=1365924 RepID=A0ABS4TAG8_9PSEU|nr:hypothetical protein [Kibdelosporangium banguiense]